MFLEEEYVPEGLGKLTDGLYNSFSDNLILGAVVMGILIVYICLKCRKRR